MIFARMKFRSDLRANSSVRKHSARATYHAANIYCKEIFIKAYNISRFGKYIRVNISLTICNVRIEREREKNISFLKYIACKKITTRSLPFMFDWKIRKKNRPLLNSSPSISITPCATISGFLNLVKWQP